MEAEKIVITLWGTSFEIVHKCSNSKYDIHRIYEDGSYTKLRVNIKSIHRCLEIIEDDITADFKHDIVRLSNLKAMYETK